MKSQKSRFKYTFPLTIFFAIAGFACQETGLDESSSDSDVKNTVAGGICRFGTEISGSFPLARYFPEHNATYASYHFYNEANLGFKLTGQLVNARYQGFDVFDKDTGNPLGALADDELIFEVENNQYTIWLLPEGVSVNPEDKPNVIRIPSASRSVGVLSRRYLKTGFNFGGGPHLEAINTQTWESRRCPQNAPAADTTGIFDLSMQELRKLPLEDNVSFYRVSVDGLTPATHNKYLITRIGQPRSNPLVLRFRAPKEHQVRYWSICSGDLSTSATPNCIHDEKMNVDRDGFVHLVVRPGIQTFDGNGANNYSYLSWPNNRDLILSYRQLLAEDNFVGRISQVSEQAASDIEESGVPAHSLMGDYSPQGVFCHPEVLKQGRCFPQ